MARPRSKFLRVGRWALGSLLILAVLLVATGWWLLHASLPTLDGNKSLNGLREVVTVERDVNGVPTIHAHNKEDLFRALGYLHAKDRFCDGRAPANSPNSPAPSRSALTAKHANTFSDGARRRCWRR